MATPGGTTTCPATTKLNEFPPSSLYDEIVTLRVGKDAKKFILHKGLLCYYSLYFKTLSNGRWPQCDKPTLDLPNDDAGTWKCVFSWLYTHRLEFEVEPKYNTMAAKHDASRAGYVQLCKIYVVGDIRQMPAIKNAAIDAFLALCVDSRCLMPWMATTNYAYENTPEESGLRKLLAHMHSKSEYPSCWKNRVDTWKRLANKDFWADVTLELAELRGPRGVEPLKWSAWRAVDKCQYHDHTPVEPLSDLQSLPDTPD